MSLRWSRAVVSPEISEAAGGMVCGLGFRTCSYLASSFLRRRRMTMASSSILQFMLKTVRSFERSG